MSGMFDGKAGLATPSPGEPRRFADLANAARSEWNRDLDRRLQEARAKSPEDERKMQWQILYEEAIGRGAMDCSDCGTTAWVSRRRFGRDVREPCPRCAGKGWIDVPRAAPRTKPPAEPRLRAAPPSETLRAMEVAAARKREAMAAAIEAARED